MLKSILWALFGLLMNSKTALGQTPAYPDLPWNATYPNSPQPWNISVNLTFTNTARDKVAHARLVSVHQQPSPADGPPATNVTDIQSYWVNHYDWSAVQTRLNRFHHFTTTVRTGPGSTYTDPVPLHFVHHRSSRRDAIPLIFFHGFPGSWLEVTHIIDLLTNPSNSSDPAFHVVAPSLPGFGFSPSPLKPNFAAREIAQAGNALMQQLGYTRYVAQGGDFGGIIIRWLAAQFPDNVVSINCNFWEIPPTPEEWQRYVTNNVTADEKDAFTKLIDYNQYGSGYRIMQQTRPLQEAWALTDSPLGWALWVYNAIRGAVDFLVWTPEEIITWSYMYYFQGPYPAFHLYNASVPEGTLRNMADPLSLQNFANGIAPFFGNGIPFVRQPVSISLFPVDIWSAPLSWAQRGGNVVRRYVHNRGGHFAAYETPDILAADLRNFFGNATLSGTGVFLSQNAPAAD